MNQRFRVTGSHLVRVNLPLHAPGGARKGYGAPGAAASRHVIRSTAVRLARMIEICRQRERWRHA